MHKLDRTAVAEPTCLQAYDYRTQTWDDFTQDTLGCKRAVRRALQRMQGRRVVTDESDDEAYEIIGLRCAYCESQIFYGGHIEHFRRKNRSRPDSYPELTFSWTNLFLACVSVEHCGHYKDRPTGAAYDPDELIKPDEHDPSDYLYFHSSGEVRVRNNPGMTNTDRRRGSETIRVFNLDCGLLRGSRRKVLKKYTAGNPNILEELMQFEPADRLEFITQEIGATETEPHSTVIRHYFEKAH
jgi:uncharacterized protein (TIGR02646 family)